MTSMAETVSRILAAWIAKQVSESKGQNRDGSAESVVAGKQVDDRRIVDRYLPSLTTLRRYL